MPCVRLKPNRTESLSDSQAGIRETQRRLSNRRFGTSHSYDDRLFDQKRFFSGKERNGQCAGKRKCNEKEESCAILAALVAKISDQHRKHSFRNAVGSEDHTHDSAED